MNVTISILAVLAALTPGCQAGKEAPPKSNDRQVPVRVLHLKPEAFEQHGEFLGELSAVVQAPLIAHTGGRVIKVHAREGDPVKKGDRLCDIDGVTRELQLESARLAVRTAKRTWQRRQQALKSGASSRQQLDQAHRDFLQSRLAGRQAARAVEGAFCVAPVAGRVVQRHIDPWQYLQAGHPTFLIADLSRMRVRFGIPENDMAGYRPENAVTLRLPAIPGRVWQGKLISISGAVDSGSRTFTAEARFDNPDGLLRPGLTGRLSALRLAVDGGLIVPTSAVQTRGDQQFVWVAEEATARRRPVKVGAGDASRSLITAGLNPGDQVIVAGHLLVGEGAPLRILQGEVAH